MGTLGNGTVAHSGGGAGANVMTTDSPRRVTNAFCPCGAPLTQRATGRPRRTCSDRCRRRAFRARAMIERRLQWIEEWRALADSAAVSREEADREVEALLADVDELRQRREGAHASRGRSGGGQS